MSQTVIKLNTSRLTDGDTRQVDAAVARFNATQRFFSIEHDGICQLSANLDDTVAVASAMSYLATFDAYRICVTSARLSDNWFSHTNKAVSLISTHEWLSTYGVTHVDGHLLYEFALAIYLFSCRISEEEAKTHDDPTGCLLDMCMDKRDVLLGMRCGYLCAEHRDLFMRYSGDREQFAGIEAIMAEVRSMALGRPQTESAERDASTPVADVAILCAIDDPELRQVLNALDPFKTPDEWDNCEDIPRSVHVYRTGSIRSDAGEHIRVVAAASRHMGLTASALLTSEVVNYFRPTLVMMVGIAAGADPADQSLGDILIAEQGYNYGSGKVKQGGVFAPDFRQVEVKGELIGLLRQFGAVPVLSDIRGRWPVQRPLLPPLRWHLGPLGSADQVVDDNDRVREVVSHMRKLVGLDMETYAVYRACVDAPISERPLFVSLKSVCDFACQKNDNWQDYAAYTAAQFAVRFLRAKWGRIRELR